MKIMNLKSHIAEIFRTFSSRHQQTITKICCLYLLDVAIIISYTKSRRGGGGASLKIFMTGVCGPNLDDTIPYSYKWPSPKTIPIHII